MIPAIGLVGTSRWAEAVHAVSLASSADVEFAGIWGRNDVERDRIARRVGVRSFGSYADLLAAVDAVDLAVPPRVQKSLAIHATRAGRDVLLEKPIGLGIGDALELSDAITAAGVHAVVFLTRLFDPVRSAWLEESASVPWESGRVEWRSGALSPTGGYADSVWRQKGGALWDLGPHVLSQLTRVLGPVTGVAVPGYEPRGMTVLRFRHGGERRSLVRMTVHGDPADRREWIEFSEGGGRTSRAPLEPLDHVAGHRRALRRLVCPGVRAEYPGESVEEGTSVAAAMADVRVLSVADDLIRERDFSAEFAPVRDA